MKETIGRYVRREETWNDKDKERHVAHNTLIPQFKSL